MKQKEIEPTDLVVHFLNVGFGDNIIIEFPIDVSGNRRYGIVDCYNFKKTVKYLDKLIPGRNIKTPIEFVCATHPHRDHILGINSLLKHNYYRPKEFWDNGFRHRSVTYKNILLSILNSNIEMIRVSSGNERYYGKVRMTVLSPSVALRNRYATYGVDMNNSSVVLRLEHHGEDILTMRSNEYKGNKSYEAERKAGQSVIILAGDAEFDSWSHVSQDYPKLERTSTHDPLVKKMINYLSCSVIKVSHHGSMHSAPIDIYEKMDPELAIISAKQEQKKKKHSKFARGLFPHDITIKALEECESKILTTDGYYESMIVDGEKKDKNHAHEGSIVVAVSPGGKPGFIKLDDGIDTVPDPPDHVWV